MDEKHRKDLKNLTDRLRDCLVFSNGSPLKLPSKSISNGPASKKAAQRFQRTFQRACCDAVLLHGAGHQSLFESNFTFESLKHNNVYQISTISTTR